MENKTINDVVSQLEKIQMALEQGLEQNYKQIEALVMLSNQLDLRAALPPMRGWAISPDFAVMLLNTIQMYQPQYIVELGSGVSTLIAGYALEKQGSGRLISIDHTAAFSDLTRRNVERHGLSDYVEFVQAGLKPLTIRGEEWEWYAVDALAIKGSIGLLVVDGPPQINNPKRMARYPALPILFERLSKGAQILLDDADREDEQRTAERWLSEFPLDVAEYVYTEKGAKLFTVR
jgi:hypothetical protein